MDELTTLCDVKACAILYSPYEARPVVWPGPSGARDVIASFKRLPEMEKVKKMVSQEEFLRQRVSKAHEQLKRQQKENREKEMTQIMYECLTGKSIQNMSFLDLSDLGWVINQNLNEINKRIEGFEKGKSSSNVNNINTNDNNNNNNTINNNNNNSVDHCLVSGLPPYQQGVGPGMESEVLQAQKGNFDAMQMQMMVQPWSSFMDMMGPPMVFDHHQQHSHPHPHAHPHPHHGMGMGGGGLGNGLYGGASGGASSSTSNTNSTNMVMMMGQFGEYHGHGINPALWSNAFFPK